VAHPPDPEGGVPENWPPGSGPQQPDGAPGPPPPGGSERGQTLVDSWGALLQEGIDVMVILNALRAGRITF